MRFLSAILTFLLSLGLFVGAGIHMALAANATSLSVAGQTADSANYVVIPGEVLTRHRGGQEITIESGGPAIIVVGRDIDVAGWLGQSKHTDASLGENGAVTFANTGTSPDTATPAGNDMWTAEYESEGSKTFSTELPPGYSVMVATKPGVPAVKSVTVAWPSAGRAPWSGPLLLGGSIALVAALALLLRELIKMREEQRRLATAPSGRVPVMAKAPGRQPQNDGAGASVAEIDADVADDESEPEGYAVAEALEDPAYNENPEQLAQEDSLLEEPSAVDSDGPERYAEHSFEDESDSADESEYAIDPGYDAAQERVDTVFDEFGAPDLIEPSPQYPASSSSVDQWGEETRVDDLIEPPRQVLGVEPVAEDTEWYGYGEDQEASFTDDATQPPYSEEYGEDAYGYDDQDGDDTDDSDGSSDVDAGDPSVSGSPEESKWKRPRGRNRSSAPKRLFSVAAIGLSASLGLSGCSPEMWPEALGGAEENPTGTPTSTVDEAILQEGAAPPALNAAQLERILADVSKRAQESDQKVDAKQLSMRFSGSAFAERAAMYKARKADPSLPEPIPFPTGEVAYVLPVATKEWPRTVIAIVQPEDPLSQTPSAVTLVQNNPREWYKVEHLVNLVPNAELPSAAPSDIGAKPLSDVVQGLKMPPEQIAAAYGDVIANGEGSAQAGNFAIADDPLLPQIGQAYRKQQLAQLDADAVKLDFGVRPGQQAPIGAATLDEGAIVAVTLEETERLSAKTELASISVNGSTAALAGTAQSRSGFDKVYTDQLLFYVPPASSDGQVRLIGYSQTLTSARQLDPSEV